MPRSSARYYSTACSFRLAPRDARKLIIVPEGLVSDEYDGSLKLRLVCGGGNDLQRNCLTAGLLHLDRSALILEFLLEVRIEVFISIENFPCIERVFSEAKPA